MTSQKFIAFMEKLLAKTKTGEIEWSRFQSVPSWASKNRSFFCHAGELDIRFYSDEDFDSMTFVIRYDSDMPSASLEVESDAEKRVALRLANYIYDLFPNLEKSIDQFLDNF